MKYDTMCFAGSAPVLALHWLAKANTTLAANVGTCIRLCLRREICDYWVSRAGHFIILAPFYSWRNIYAVCVHYSGVVLRLESSTRYRHARA